MWAAPLQGSDDTASDDEYSSASITHTISISSSSEQPRVLACLLQAQKHALELSLLEARRFTPVIEPDMSPEEQAEAQAAANVRALLAQAQVGWLAAAMTASVHLRLPLMA